jgi:glycogen operon protein
MGISKEFHLLSCLRSFALPHFFIVNNRYSCYGYIMEVIAKKYETRPGQGYPPGAAADTGGVNFSVFSRHATGVELLLYQQAKSPEPFQIIRLNPETNRTYFFWHVYVEGLSAGVHYTWRVSGPRDTRRTGFRFNKKCELLDPWARAVTDELWDRRRTHNL